MKTDIFAAQNGGESRKSTRGVSDLIHLSAYQALEFTLGLAMAETPTSGTNQLAQWFATAPFTLA